MDMLDLDDFASDWSINLVFFPEFIAYLRK